MSGSLARTIYRGVVGAGVLAALPFRGSDWRAVFYGGARSGDVGGTLVKVSLLQSRFPERRVGFSLLYLLSNALYVPQTVINRVRASGIPIVLNQNGVFYPGWYPDGWQQENERIARVHAAADHVFYQSEFCRHCAARFLGVRSGPSEILYNGVDTSRFTPSAGSRRGGPFRFLVTGKIGVSTAHRLKSSIDGLAAARKGGLDVSLTIAGYVESAVLDQAKRQINQLRLSDAVVFTGSYAHADAPAIYRGADAYLMTKYNDPCPNSVLEALASGLPVLYSASGGVPELVGSDAGVGLAIERTFDADLVPTREAIAEGMAQIIAGRANMSAAARRRAVERFDLQQWLNRHEAVFRDLVAA